MSKKRLTVAVIGAGGNMRGAHLPRIERDGFARIVGAADPVSEQIDRFTERAGYEVPAFSDWREMLAETDSDAVFISTPHSDHHAQIKACLDAGRHVLVEKPMVMTPGQARSTLRNAEQAKRLLMVAYQRHWMPEYVYAKELITKGALGEIRGVVGYVTQNWGALGGWRLDPEKAGGGMYMDTGSHLVASMLWMTGLRPAKVSATFDNARRPVDINAAVQIAFTGGAVGTLTTIGNASPPRRTPDDLRQRRLLDPPPPPMASPLHAAERRTGVRTQAHPPRHPRRRLVPLDPHEWEGLRTAAVRIAGGTNDGGFLPFGGRESPGHSAVVPSS